MRQQVSDAMDGDKMIVFIDEVKKTRPSVRMVLILIAIKRNNSSH